MTQAMLERAARAVGSVVLGPDERGGPVFPDYYTALELARTVLTAVRDNAPTRAMAESQARGDEGIFLPLLDLLDFSGENARDMVLRAAWCAAIDAILNERPR